MKTAIEILIPDLPGSSVAELQRQVAHLVSAFGVTPVSSTYTPEAATLAVLDAVAAGTLETGKGTYARPAASIRTYSA